MSRQFQRRTVPRTTSANRDHRCGRCAGRNTDRRLWAWRPCRTLTVTACYEPVFQEWVDGWAVCSATGHVRCSSSSSSRRCRRPLTADTSPTTPRRRRSGSHRRWWISGSPSTMSAFRGSVGPADSIDDNVLVGDSEHGPRLPSATRGRFYLFLLVLTLGREIRGDERVVCGVSPTRGPIRN